MNAPLPDDSSGTGSPRRGSATEVLRELGPRLVLPGLGLALLSLGAVAYLGSLVESPFRLTIFFYLFRTHEAAVALLYGGALLIVAFVARAVPTSACDRLVLALDERPWGFVALVFTVLAASSLLVYRSHPLSMDEYTTLFQAEVFATGRLIAQVPPALVPWLIPDLFVGHFFAVSTNGEIAARYLPGFSLLLAPFAWLGVPWLLNPLLSVTVLLLLRAIARRLLPGTTAAGWAMLLAAASTELTVNGISLYSMNAHLAANLLFALLLLRPGLGSTFAAGVVGSFALALHQPLPHVFFAAPWIVWLALGGRRGRRRLAVLALGYLPLSALLVLGWLVLRSGLASSTSEGGLLAVVSAVFAIPPAWVFGVRLLELLLLFLWAAPGLPMLAVLGLRKHWQTPWALFAWSLPLSFCVLLFVPIDQGHGWGPRYPPPAWGALPLLGAAFLAGVGRRRPGWTGAAALLVGIGLFVATPLRFNQAHAFIDRHLSQLPPLPADLEGSVSFLDVRRGYYAADLVQNDPFLRDPHWILVSHGREADEAFVRSLAPGARLILDNGSETAWAVHWGGAPSRDH